MIFNQFSDSAAQNVQMLGFVDAAKVIPAADIFLSTSLNEGIPYSFLEVLSAGVPIVAVKSGAIEEIIADGLNGFLVSQDPDEIASQINSLFTNSESIMAARHSALNSNTILSQKMTMADAHESIYNQVAGIKSE